MHENYKEILYSIPTIECEGINLRRHILNDAESILEFASDEETLRYLDWDGVKTIEEARKSIYDYYWSAPFFYAIVTKDTDKCIGTIDIRPDVNNDKMQFGYLLSRAFWGRGYMTQALSAMLDICFNKLNVNKVEAYHYDDNVGSGKVMEKCGMLKEGVSLQNKVVKGKFVDVTMYGILKSQYKPYKRIERK